MAGVGQMGPGWGWGPNLFFFSLYPPEILNWVIPERNSPPLYAGGGVPQQLLIGLASLLSGRLRDIQGRWANGDSKGQGAMTSWHQREYLGDHPPHQPSGKITLSVSRWSQMQKSLTSWCNCPVYHDFCDANQPQPPLQKHRLVSQADKAHSLLCNLTVSSWANQMNFLSLHFLHYNMDS